MNQDSKRQITLEDILRLKRAERPPAEFWQQFDRELRAKQLSALVEKRPWWRTLPRVLPRFSRYQLPLGAAALLTVTFVVTRNYHTSVVAPTQASKLAVQSTPFHAENGSISKSPALPFDKSEEAALAATSTFSVATSASNEAVTGAELAGSSSALPEITARGGTHVLREETAPAVRTVAASLNAIQASVPAVSRGLLTSTSGFESRALPARTPVVEPLTQMRNPADASRARFQSAMAFSFANQNPARVNERVAHRLSDEKLRDDGAHWFNAKGNSLAVSF